LLGIHAVPVGDGLPMMSHLLSVSVMVLRVSVGFRGDRKKYHYNCTNIC